MIFEDGTRVSAGTLLARSEEFAAYLSENLRQGSVVAVMGANRAEFMVAWFASVGAGCAVVALNPQAGSHDLEHVLRDSSATLAIADSKESQEVLERLSEDLPKLEHVLLMGEGEPDGLTGYETGERLDFRELDLDPDTITNIYYTSGTTGPPKGCMVNHRYWKRLVDSYLEERGLGEDDRILCCLKFFYNDPSWQLLASLSAGAPLVIMRKFSVSRFWRVVNDNGVTQLFTIGSIPALLLSAPASPLERQHSVRFGVQVAIDAERHREMVERWGVPWVDSYGLTETGGLVSVPLADAEAMIGRGTMGRPRKDVEIRLVDESGADMPAGKPGELLARVPDMMVGYLNRPDATKAAIDEENWFHTGDVVRADEDGWLYFSGRKKDIVRRAGENISASEVEEVLRGHPQVIDAAVVPVADELKGEEILAHLYVGEASTEALPEDVAGFCTDKLARHKLPRYLIFRHEDFPRTPSMRIAKNKIEHGTVPDGAWDCEQAEVV